MTEFLNNEKIPFIPPVISGSYLTSDFEKKT